MPIFKDLIVGKKYLINEFDGDQVLLIEPIMVTEFCMLIVLHEDVETVQWKKLNDEIFEIIEELSEEKEQEYEELFEYEEEMDFDDDYFEDSFPEIEDQK
jgi:predicted nucleic acid-binding protein